MAESKYHFLKVSRNFVGLLAGDLADLFRSSLLPAVDFYRNSFVDLFILSNTATTREKLSAVSRAR